MNRRTLDDFIQAVHLLAGLNEPHMQNAVQFLAHMGMHDQSALTAAAVRRALRRIDPGKQEAAWAQEIARTDPFVREMLRLNELQGGLNYRAAARAYRLGQVTRALSGDADWAEFEGDAQVFLAGRIDGIRQERARRAYPERKEVRDNA